MTSTRAKSPDRYIGITKSFQERCLTQEEKCMLLNVYGILRKELPTVKEAAARAADLCGVGISALFSAKKEFDNCEITLARSSSDSLGIESVQLAARDSRSRDSEEYSVVKAKVLEMLGTSGTTTVESVVEAIRRDPRLPRLEENAIRRVIQQLNLTSCLSIVTPEQVELQQTEWDTSLKGVPWKETSDTTATAVSSFGPNVEANVDITARNEVADSDCCIVYCETVGADFQTVKVETILPDPDERETGGTFEFHLCADVKTEEPAGGETADVSLDSGIFPNRPTPSELGGEDAGKVAIFAGGPESYANVNAYAFASNVQTEPYAGILVYGINRQNIPEVISLPDSPVPPPKRSRRTTKTKQRKDKRNKSCDDVCQCRYCPQVFAAYRTKEFVQHTMYVHTMRSLQCDFCNLSFGAAVRLAHHVASSHMDSFLQQQGITQT